MTILSELKDVRDSYPRFLSYLHSYPALLAHFRKPIKSTDDIVVAAHIAYGWMPTALTVHGNRSDLECALNAFQMLVEDTSEHQIGDLNALSKVFNNSLVGVSKMLHFAAPERYAIWDSKVAAACNYPFHGNRRRNAAAYLNYVSSLTALVDHVDYDESYERIKAHIAELGIDTSGTNFTRLRSGELTLFCSHF